MIVRCSPGPRHSQACVTGSPHTTVPAFPSPSTVLPSRVVDRNRDVVSAYATTAGWECIGSFSPGLQRNSRTRTWSLSRSTVYIYGDSLTGSCANANSVVTMTIAATAKLTMGLMRSSWCREDASFSRATSGVYRIRPDDAALGGSPNRPDRDILSTSMTRRPNDLAMSRGGYAP